MKVFMLLLLLLQQQPVLHQVIRNDIWKKWHFLSVQGGNDSCDDMWEYHRWQKYVHRLRSRSIVIIFKGQQQKPDGDRMHCSNFPSLKILMRWSEDLHTKFSFPHLHQWLSTVLILSLNEATSNVWRHFWLSQLVLLKVLLNSRKQKTAMRPEMHRNYSLLN